MNLLLLFLALAFPGQYLGPTPGQAMRMAYTEMSPPILERFDLRHAQGQVKGREGAPIPHVRLGLYTDAAPHRLVAITITDDNGKFDFGDQIAAGDYRLVAIYPGLCTANVPLQLDRHARKHQLDLVLEYPGLDLCARAQAK